MRHFWIWSGVLASGLFWGGTALAQPAKKWSTASDVLAVGLPVVAGAISYAKSDIQGLEQLAISQAMALASSGLLKGVVDAPRPNGQDHHSFPSRHTAVAFSAASYLDLRYGEELGNWRPVLYSAAGLAGIGRVQAREHRWVDVLGGATLGYGLSSFGVKPLQQGRLTVLPTPGSMWLAWQQSF